MAVAAWACPFNPCPWKCHQCHVDRHWVLSDNRASLNSSIHSADEGRENGFTSKTHAQKHRCTQSCITTPGQTDCYMPPLANSLWRHKARRLLLCFTCCFINSAASPSRFTTLCIGRSMHLGITRHWIITLSVMPSRAPLTLISILRTVSSSSDEFRAVIGQMSP